ncbi:MAG: type 2 isopentenyl-diphosphate Delta-isomerase [Candidatus Thermoplasmatota archaeon]|jgi:isopentenyl-diphosphate delta-isomerase|nr:type 2 isopentenyl-diphosphate Delta-isomerase [Candidatus Thermoplasmatota archaeon]MCL5874088.1 type 2 isopentenyl-diphosphate Delta-isomerase [Candidatus Thermoplasmatota archaeon]
MTVERRKLEHIDIISTKNVSHDYNYWDDVEIVQRSMPEVDFDEIDTSTKFLGRKLRLPLLISSMTGGHPETRKINENLARGAAEAGIAMGVGSERAAILNRKVGDSYSVVAEYDVPFRIANVGAPQLIRQSREALTDEEVGYAVDLVKADALAIHFNFVQELSQPEGDRNAKGVRSRVGELSRKYRVIAKETGAGFSVKDALDFKQLGVSAIDTGGRSGTSFAAVESMRSIKEGEDSRKRVGNTFWNWGIPSPISLLYCNVELPLIASGGIRSGLDVFRGLSMGASLGGLASTFLKAALQSDKEVVSLISRLEAELKSAMMLTGCSSINDIKKVKKIYRGRLLEWMNQS